MILRLNKVMSEQFPQVATKVNSLQPDDLPDKLKSAVTEERNRNLKIMQVSLDLLSENIKKYFDNALQQLWPFMPPTIVPDMMFETNPFVPKLCQADLLLTALNYAIECSEFHYASALAFVVDRFMYWYGGSEVLLKIIDHILVLSPSTVIAPQLTIRRARIMKDNGNLHGAIKVLDGLIDSKAVNEDGKWHYRTEFQYINVYAVCVQIKGQIYHNLGLWKEAVPLLLKSVEDFEKLPDKDLKGISYSYGLLSHCLCKLSHKEYLELQNVYVFQRDHPCYEAFEYGMKAAELSPKQSLFFARHCLQSSESLLMYAVQVTDLTQRKKILADVIVYLQNVIFANNIAEISKSKEQLFIFIKGIYVTALVLGCTNASADQYFGDYLEKACLYLYRKFSLLGIDGLDSKKGGDIFKEMLPAIKLLLVTFKEPTIERQAYFISSFDSMKTSKTEEIEDIKRDGCRLSKEYEKTMKEREEDYKQSSHESNPTVTLQKQKVSPGNILEDSEIVLSEERESKCMVDTNVVTKERNTECMADPNAVTKERGSECMANPNAVTKERGPDHMADPNEVTKERGSECMADPNEVTKERSTECMADPNAVTKKRGSECMADPNEVTKERGSECMVDPNEVTKERSTECMADPNAVTKEKGSECMADPNEVTKERDSECMVDPNAVTKEKGSECIADPNAVTKERSTECMADPNAVTKERGPEYKADPNAVTKERGPDRIANPNAVTKERSTECMADPNAVTKERGSECMADPNAVTKERGPECMADPNAITKERSSECMVDSNAVINKTKDKCTGNNVSKANEKQEQNCEEESVASSIESGYGSLTNPSQNSSTYLQRNHRSYKQQPQRYATCSSSLQNCRNVGLHSDLSVKDLSNIYLVNVNYSEEEEDDGIDVEDNIIDGDGPAREEVSEKYQGSVINRNAERTLRHTRQKQYEERKAMRQKQLVYQIPPKVQDEPILTFLYNNQDGSILTQLTLDNIGKTDPTYDEYDEDPNFSWFDDQCDNLDKQCDNLDKQIINRLQKAVLYHYNPVTLMWYIQDTIVYISKELSVGKKGGHRDVYEMNFLHQDEPLGRYICKRYRKEKDPLYYLDDVKCQMEAGLYVTYFNQALKSYQSDIRIHYLPAAYMHLLDANGVVEMWVNIEPYVEGEFLKLTDNYSYCNPRGRDMSTAFTHFTHSKSAGKIMVVDLQGWLPSGVQNIIYLTDPQFHTIKGDNSTFDFGIEGFKVFFDKVHPKCNHICETLKLERPDL